MSDIADWVIEEGFSSTCEWCGKFGGSHKINCEAEVYLDSLRKPHLSVELWRKMRFRAILRKAYLAGAEKQKHQDSEIALRIKCCPGGPSATSKAILNQNETKNPL